MTIIWLTIVIVLSIIELMTINLITIWFVASGLVALVVSFFNISPLIQVSIFVILGIILLLLTRKSLTKFVNKKKVPTNADRLIGMEGIVTEKITKNKPGEVKVDGKRWTAIADNTIGENHTVKILRIEGVKLIVKEEEE